MIRRLRGTVISRRNGELVVDVHGVGYGVLVPKRLSSRELTEVDLFIFTHVREDSLCLFGFFRELDLEVFELLLTVPMIGPVKAMGILETPAEDLIAQVSKKNVGQLSKLPGVGKKTAERMVIDLFDKFGRLPSNIDAPHAEALPARAHGDLTSALVNLGFRAPLAAEVAGRTVTRLGETTPLEGLLREALSQLMAR